jgi:hypothetical protein
VLIQHNVYFHIQSQLCWSVSFHPSTCITSHITDRIETFMLHNSTSNGDEDDNSSSTGDADGALPIHNVGNGSVPGTLPSLDEILFSAVASL